jgi:hypothetical protein
MVFYATFNNILLVEETEVPEENHQLAASQSLTNFIT